jgi:hypothetical protein
MLVETPIYDQLTLQAYDFRAEFPCEDGRHARGICYHSPDQPGEWFMFAPCCGGRAIICRSRKEYLSGPTCAEIRCTRCDLKHPAGAYRFELIV